MRALRIPILLFFFLMPVGNAVADTGYLHSLRNTNYHAVAASEIGRSFHTFVMLPDSYAENTPREYPTIYLLDGGSLFPMLVSYYRVLLFAGEVEESIIVGISYGSVDFEGGNYRSTDFTAPAEERDYWGGAERFQRFLKKELFPFIEGEYRSQADRRVLFGHSLGGQFVLYSAQTDPGLFWGRVASNPAMHRNLDFFLNTVPGGESDSYLFVAAAANDDDRFRQPWLRWHAHWSAREQLPWTFKAIELPGHNHMSSLPAAFRQGTAWLFRQH